MSKRYTCASYFPCDYDSTYTGGGYHTIAGINKLPMAAPTIREFDY